MARVSRKTKQKELLYEEILKMRSFFTAENLLNKKNIKNQKIGIATVYRFLKYLTRKEKIHSYLCQGKKIYSNNKKSHCHFTCEKCNQTRHIYIKDLNFLKNNLIGNVCHFQLDVYGICNSCFLIDN